MATVRRIARQKMNLCIKSLETSANHLSDAMSPYREVFPEKAEMEEKVLTAMLSIRTVLEKIRDDV